jgi:hypothetical protein
MVKRKVCGSTVVGILAKCHRTKKASLGVNTDSLNTENGVSNWGGLVVITIKGRFSGKATSGRLPRSKGRVALDAGSAPTGKFPNAERPPTIRLV